MLFYAVFLPVQNITVIGAIDGQTDGVTQAETKAETVMHDLHYPGSPHWNQVVVSVEITITN